MPGRLFAFASELLGGAEPLFCISLTFEADTDDLHRLLMSPDVILEQFVEPVA